MHDGPTGTGQGATPPWPVPAVTRSCTGPWGGAPGGHLVRAAVLLGTAHRAYLMRQPSVR
ncbi:hypothetical protein ACFVW8_30465 [Streptomyces sp. NPDC058221]|uniref:hypothetical protein n=1 Tax=Streptomyces sp. NPDC058221 TaxID=3346388 RepID=UPI0036E3688D